MVYTVKALAKLSGVSVRTLHWYDEIGLLKPAYYGANGYRYYEEKELLLLQQILFFRELGFELKKIQKILGKGDFDQHLALISHREVLKKELVRLRRLIKTIDKTIEHIKGKRKMKDKEMYFGFEKQEEYERYLINRFGEETEKHIIESKAKIKDWTKADHEKAQKEFERICKELVILLKAQKTPDSREVQALVKRHYEWLLQFWTPNKKSYIGHSELIVDSDLKEAYEKYDPELPQFLKKAIVIFAEKSLS